MMNAKRLRLVVASLTGMAALLLSTTASAQELKIGVVSLQAVIQNAPQTKASMEALQEEFAPRERTVLAKQKELEELSEKAQRDLAVMGEDERRTMERDLRDKQRELQRLQEEFVEDRNLRQNEELGKLQRLAVEEVNAFAKANGFDMILVDGVVAVSAKADVTAEVVAQLQQKAGN
ncbi:MAG: OmpH family outer membrane protein [Pseudomonadota bacterium]